MTTARQGVIQAVVVDLDGTMIDTMGDFVVAINATLADLQLPAVSAAFISNAVGKGSDHLISVCLDEAGGAAALKAAAWERYQHHYLEVNGRHAQVYPGVVEGLAALRDLGLPLVCVTNKPGAFAQPLLQAKGLAGFFRATFGGDAFTHKKPHPEPLLRSCAVLGSPPERTLMIGDSINDASAARAAGCPVVLMRYGYNHGEPVEAAGADAVFDRLDQIPVWLARRGQF